MIPPPYPRIAHLFPQPGMDADDKVMPSSQASRLLATTTLLVEEKLDGFNIAIARNEMGWPTPYARSGKTEKDRGGQLGRIRAYLGEQAFAFETVLATWPVIYAEWLMRQHSVVYDALPAWLVVLDFWSPSAGFAGFAARNALCAQAGLATPPSLFTGIVGDVKRLEELTQRSRFSSHPAEGCVLRDALTPEQAPVAKWLAPHFRRRSDDELGRAGHNTLQPR